MLKKLKVLLVLFMVLTFFVVSKNYHYTNVFGTNMYSGSKVIVIDAGHGGIDSGCSKNGVLEKDINLEISNYTARLLRACGITTICTRTADYEVVPKTPDITYRKRWQKDLAKRVAIAEEVEASALVSIHINSISSSKWSGAQVFYKPEREDSQVLATVLQEELNKTTGGHRLAHIGDYYITRESSMPSVIIEAGFLSNAKESALLVKEEYQKQIAWSITRGILRWLAEK